MAHVQSAGSVATKISTRRASALEKPETDFTRRRSTSVRRLDRDDLNETELTSLTRSASRISGHREAYNDNRLLSSITRPQAAKPGGVNTIREVPSEFVTPLSSRPPSPDRFLTISRPASPSRVAEVESLLSQADDDEDDIEVVAERYPDVGRIKSWRGAAILLCVCGAQLMDNVFMTGVNMSLPAIQHEFDVISNELQWLISAYTLTFGGFLLLSGVLADRYGRRHVFCIGMLFLSIWTLANGFATSFIQMAVFRALQGIGAAATVPSSVGIISSYFVAQDRTRGLSLFGAAGAVGFVVGLIFGGFLTSSLGWRWLFYLAVILTGSIGLIGWFILPKDRLRGHEKPKLDFLGASLSTAGLVLLSFVLSSGGEYGWSKAFIIVLLVTSVISLIIFTWVEKKVSNPIMPLSLWKLPNFAALWISGFVMYGGYQSVVYYTTLMAQDVDGLTASETAIRFVPMGVVGFVFSLAMGKAVEMFNVKHLLLLGMAMCTLAPVSSALMTENDLNFWKHVFPTTLIVVIGVTIVYCTITVVLLASVPVNVKSLCGGMINTAFQIGSGVGLALSTAVVQSVDVNHGHPLLKQYGTGLWCCVGLAGIGFVASAVGVKNVERKDHEGVIQMH